MIDPITARRLAESDLEREVMLSIAHRILATLANNPFISVPRGSAMLGLQIKASKIDDVENSAKIQIAFHNSGQEVMIFIDGLTMKHEVEDPAP